MSSTTAAPVAAPIPLPVGRLAAIGAVIFIANAAMLVLQLVAGKLLSPFIGSSLETWTSIIGVFLAGIALGNGYGGKLADRYPTPRTLAVLLALGAVAALWMLAFPMLLAATGLHQSLPLSPRIPILAAVLCLPAGFVLSLLTPLAIKLGLPDVSHTGRVAGLIFALSTLGCLIGNYVTGFYLIPTFTLNILVVVSAGALLALAGVALLLPSAKAESPHPPAPSPRGEGEKGTGSAPSDSTLPRLSPPLPGERGPGGEGAGANPHAFKDIRKAYLVVFLASFCGMTLELTASRVLSLQLGVSLFTWTGIIGVMLAGTALGNFTGGHLADHPRRAAAWLAGAVVLVVTVALAGAGALLLFDDPEYPTAEYAVGVSPEFWPQFRELSYQEYRRLERDGKVSAFVTEIRQRSLPRLQKTLTVALLGGALVGGLLAAFVVRRRSRPRADGPPDPRYVLAATLCAGGAGTVLLFVTMALITRFHLFGTWEPIVQVMAWTFGLFFLPMFALGLVSPQVIRLAVPDTAHVGRVAGRVYAWSTVGAIVGTFAAGYVLLSTFGMYGTILGASLVLVLVSLLVAKVWDDNALLYLFSIVLGGVTGGFILTAREREENLVAKVESNYYTIKVKKHPERDTTLSLNLDLLMHSVVDPSDPTFLYYTHEYIQVEFVRAARAATAEPRVLVIGGGGYTFPRYLNTKIPETRVDVVEIDPKVTQVAYDHMGLEKHKNLHPIHMDGRQFVAERAERGSYDLVVQDAVNDLSVPGHLMTKEYNDAVKVALKPGGVYLLTIIDSVSYGKLWKSAMATLAKTFPPENVVLLRVPDPRENNPFEIQKPWYEDRHVLVIYASDRKFSPAAIYDAVKKQVPPPDPRTLVAGLTAGSVDPVGSAPLHTARLGVASHTTLKPLEPVVRTTLVDPELLRWYTDPKAPLSRELRKELDALRDRLDDPDAPVPAEWSANREPGVVLTDQFCPIDNLMAEVFRKRNR